jgi:hypothetical protein
MKANVSELMELVEGKKKRSAASKRTMSAEADRQPKRTFLSSRERAVEKAADDHKKREARKLIPLGDEVLDDF